MTVFRADELFYSGGRRARLRRAWDSLVHSIYVDAGHDHTQSVFVCGSGRSGTTWLASILNYANEYRYLYEPFNRRMVPRHRHFAVRQYLRPDDKGAAYLATARSLFTGRVRDAWIDHHNKRVFSRQRLIKDCRSNLMLKWIRNHFPGMPIVLLVRHPCAVAISKVRLGWKMRLAPFLRQPALVSDYLAPNVDRIRTARTPFEKHIIAWCIETLVPFSQLDKGDVHLIFYENLCLNPERELRNLYGYLRKPFDARLLRHVGMPSTTTRRGGDASPVLTGRNIVDDWRRHVSADELATASLLVKAFGVDEIYGDSSMPDVARAQSLLARSPAHHGAG